MTMMVLRLLLALTFPLVARAAESARVTSIFIDTVSGYDELSTCAEEVLSTIVRAQYSGCGDKGAVTSYTCFCTDSSSEMSSMITSAVSLSCDSSVASAQATSAIGVFDAYCAIGVPGDLATTTTAAAATESATESASPASTASTTAASPTSANVDPTSAASSPTPSDSMSRSKVVAIAVGVSVPCGVIIISLIACLFWCHRRRRHEQLRSEKRQQLESTSQATGVGNSRPQFRWPARIAGSQQELPTQYHNHEMPAKEAVASPSSSEYHISPRPVTPAAAQQKAAAYQLQSEKIPYQHQEFYQPPKEAHHHQQQEPQELPASSQLSVENRHELEGSLSPLSPTGRFSYQLYDK